MDEDYDEFGNFIGQLDQDEASSSEEESSDGMEEEQAPVPEDDGHDDEEEFDIHESNQIVLHEDKQYYPDAGAVFQGAEILVQTEDTQDIDKPILAHKEERQFNARATTQVTGFRADKSLGPELKYSLEFMQEIMRTRELIRNVAVVGHIHHGKYVFAVCVYNHEICVLLWVV